MKGKIGIAIILLLVGVAKVRSRTYQSIDPSYPVNEVSLRGAQQYGMKGVYVRVFHVVVVNAGSGITYTHDYMDGDSLTINQNGIYAVSYTGKSPFADTMGITVNQDPTMFLGQTAQDMVVCRASIFSSIANCSAVLALNAGDVVRAHRNAGATQGCNCDTNEDERFTIIQMTTF